MRDDRIDRRRVRRAAVVEEFVLQRARAADLLVDRMGLDVVHSCASLRTFMAWLQRADRQRWPHVLVIDPPSDLDLQRDLEVLSALRDAGMRIVVLSPLRSRSTGRRLIDAGVEGIVSTGDGEEEFLAVVDAVLTGESVITPRARASIRGSEDAPRLSAQEERVLALYATGLTIAEVADRIGVRHDTARKYLTRVRDKFTAVGRPSRSKLDLARIAWSEGYVTDDVEREQSGERRREA
ncbi:MAG: response regulator transcription factor [Microbacterium sp.]|nr:response regulator transcription factor [Microbacterium sp.]